MNVFEENPGWRERITNVIATHKPATPDSFRLWQDRVSLAKQRGQRERRDAEAQMFQLDYRDAGYKPGLLPPCELSRLRAQARANKQRSRWS